MSKARRKWRRKLKAEKLKAAAISKPSAAKNNQRGEIVMYNGVMWRKSENISVMA
jgi:hypothetical protein